MDLTALSPLCADCNKYGSLNLLEHSGSLQNCTGIALPLPIRNLQEQVCFEIKIPHLISCASVLFITPHIFAPSYVTSSGGIIFGHYGP